MATKLYTQFRYTIVAFFIDAAGSTGSIVVEGTTYCNSRKKRDSIVRLHADIPASTFSCFFKWENQGAVKYFSTEENRLFGRRYNLTKKPATKEERRSATDTVALFRRVQAYELNTLMDRIMAADKADTMSILEEEGGVEDLWQELEMLGLVAEWDQIDEEWVE